MKLRGKILSIADEFFRVPTAPFRENNVAEFIQIFLERRDIKVFRDSIGNLRAVYGESFKSESFTFCAHMDHPGFIAADDSHAGYVNAVFYGGVEEKYFKGSKVAFHTDNGKVKGKIVSSKFDKKSQKRFVRVQISGEVSRGTMGMWDLAAIRIRGDKLYARNCDDGAGCVAILALFDELAERKIHKKVNAIFTVAEEAGMHGAKYLCSNKKISKSENLIAIEASSYKAGAKIGVGVVIRVGDKASIFSPELTAFMVETAKRLKDNDKGFEFQRKLMDGGTCESTIYQQWGYNSGAVCLALGNYHNRDMQREKIAAEYVSISDMENMVKLFLALVKNSAASYSIERPKKYRLVKGELGETFYQ